jgi:cation:H+ antiporter
LVLSVLGFVVSAVANLLAGTRLTAYADVIALRTRLGRIWAGMVLLAVATSLPELINCTSAAIRNLPDIAAGDIGGSNVLNLLILGGIDVLSRNRTCLEGLHRFHLRSIGVIVAMSGVAAAGILLGSGMPALGWISPVSLVLLGLYVLSLSKADTGGDTATLAPTIPTISVRSAVTRYALLAAVVVAAAVVLPSFAARIAEETGLGATFVGTILVAVATSLPELVTAGAAVRMGAPELAAGGILGSNLFNLTIFGIVDVIYWRGSIFTAANRAGAIPLFAGLLLAGLFALVLRRCPRRRFLRITWFGWTALAVYLLTAGALFYLR